MSEPIDFQECEMCSEQFPVETMTVMEDDWICPGCYAEWKREFDACEHVWKPYTSTMSEPGRLCERCSGFVADEDADAVPVLHPGYPYLPCPLCRGVEGCDHSIPERAAAWDHTIDINF